MVVRTYPIRVGGQSGPLTAELGGADISWIVGLVVPAVLYYAWASRRNVAPAATVPMPEPALR